MNGLRLDPQNRAPPNLRDKVRRGLWGVAYRLLYKPTPRPFHAWRRMILRLFGANVGPGALVYPGAVIWAPWNLEMGERSVIADGVDCYNVAKVTFGVHVVVSQRAFLCTATRDVNDADFSLATAPIYLGAEVWIAAEAYIGPGITMQTGAVAAARAVVLKDVKAWTMVAGSPAREIGRRKPHDAHPN